jgi:outer membrane protein assembly factor BamE (lipoprotein component of BamABCDE complex)
MRPIKLIFSAVTVMLLAACNPRIDYRGKLPDLEQVEKIKPGVSTIYDVLGLIGSPTFETEYGPKQWFYVYKKTETTSFFRPDVKEKNMLAITFNEHGLVQKVEDMDPVDSEIDPIRYKTKTVGEDQPFLQQVFSNFGRVARKESSKK